ncbi:MAG: hypothetical protein KF861_07370, partial [Planctomycetaceae bacterium]|nr:hypothetical protein [Planctomycetaceae bacterium]
AVIEHPEFMPVELKTRPDLTNGHDRGRIYRIVPHTRSQSSAPTRPQGVPEDSTNAELVGQLASPNAWHRDTAARLLLERQDHTAAPLLARTARFGSSAATRV